jgi:hypothetical protein
VLAVAAIALAVRLDLLARSGWLLEGDDSLSTLMGLAILRGDRSIMLKNQPYAGAWEPYAMALSYTLFGISRVAAKLPVLVESVALVGTTWLLARAAAGPLAGRFAALLMAVPPIYVLVLVLKPWAPYLEVMLTGQLALVCAIRLAFVYSRGRPAAALAFGCGLYSGLAFYLHPLAVWYILPAAVIVALRLRGLALLRAAGLGLVGFVVGAVPLWLYNIRTGGATLRFVLAGSGGQTADRGQVLAAWWNADLPRGVGLWDPWGPTPSALSVALALVLVAALVWAVAARDWRGRRPALRPLDAVLLLLVTIPLVFVLSGFGGPALNPYGFDATGRYAPPIWTAMAVILGAWLARLWAARRDPMRPPGAAWGPGPALATGLLALVLAIFAFQWRTADPVLAFQSPYWSKLPVDNRPLLRVLRSERVVRVWMNHWAGLPAMFDARAAGQDLIAYDWYDVQAGGIDRFPEYRALVERADRPAFVLVTDEARPELEDRLDALGVAYVERRAPPYVVVIPVSRRVHPSEVTGALDYRY